MTLELSAADWTTLLDALLPGDGTFPPASAVDIAAMVRARLAVLGGADAETRLAATLLIAGTTPAGAVVLLEEERPQLFELLRRAAYMSYYEAPAVITAIQGLGVDYRGAPQPGGYELGGFDPAVDAPTHRRGRWKTTAETEGSDS